jgi:hypothetical protein
VNEAGEITFGSIEGKQLASYKLGSYAKGFAVSFQVLVNDDIGALSDLSAKITRGARAWFEGFLADTIIANPKLSDNKASSTPTTTTLPARARPRLMPPSPRRSSRSASKWTRAEIRLARHRATFWSARTTKLSWTSCWRSLYPTSSEAETAARGLIPLVEPRFDLRNHNAWYLFCDPSDAPVFEYAELSGYEGPRVESRPGWNTLGTEFRVVWHWALVRLTTAAPTRIRGRNA